MNDMPHLISKAPRVSERGNGLEKPLFFIHVMRTGGTSFRRMLENAFDPIHVYPSARMIEQRGRYPELTEVINDRDRVLAAKLIVGHYPYALRSLWPKPPLTLTLLRDPVERTLSVLKFARLRRSHFHQSTPLADVFHDEELNAAMIRNYQTKVFSIPRIDDTKGVNFPVPEYMINIELAKQRLQNCEFVGLTERFEESIEAFRIQTGIQLANNVHVNQSRTSETVDDRLRTQIMEATSLDAELIEHASGILDRRLA